MVEPYSALAAVYNRAGLSAYSMDVMPNLLEMAFLQDWLGRIILELGCGTGEVACWLTERSYRVIAVDNAPAMLTIGSTYAEQQGLDVEWTLADMRQFKPDMQLDLALALGGTLNLLPSLQDLETVVQMVYKTLEAGKLFIFDLDTLYGLLSPGDSTALIFDDHSTALITAEHTINYEALTRSSHYHLLTSVGQNVPEATLWRRSDEVHVQRCFPVGAVTRILTRAGFQVLRTMDTQLRPADPNRTARVIIMAQKPKTSVN